jgi:4-hydroxybenzoate polyprenyltransferase
MSRPYFADLNFGAWQDRTILLDLDGTLAPDNEQTVTQAVAMAVNDLVVSNRVVLLSNKKNHVRNRQIAAVLGIDYLETNLRKPDPRLKTRLGELGVEGDNLIVIGDKYLTDGLMAKVLGAEFVKVRRLISQTRSWPSSLVDNLDDAAFFVSRLLKLMRPVQWLKNVLILAPLVFAHQFFNYEQLGWALLGVVIFSLLASGVYIINDFFDREGDRAHPFKRRRPLAAGDISPRVAGILATGLLLLVTALTGVFFPATGLLLLAYFLLNLLYSRYLKAIPVVDVVTVAGFYLFRIIYGGLIIAVPVSAWLILCALFLAMLIVGSKRLGEQSRIAAGRSVLEFYSPEFLKQLTLGSGALALMSYGIYTVLTSGGQPLLYSNLPAVVGVFRLIYLAERGQDTEAPEWLIFRDRVILISVLAWLALIYLSLYF